MQIGHGVVRHTRKRAAARQVRRPGTSAPDGRTLFRTSTSTFGVQGKSQICSDTRRFNRRIWMYFLIFLLHAWMHVCVYACNVLFCLLPGGVARNRCTYSTVDSFPLAVPDPWLSSRDASLRSRCSISGGRCMARCYSSPLYLRDACACTECEHTHHPLHPRHRDLFFSLFSTRTSIDGVDERTADLRLEIA